MRPKGGAKFSWIKKPFGDHLLMNNEISSGLKIARSKLMGMPAHVFELLPMPTNSFPTGIGQAHLGVWAPGEDLLICPEQASLFQFGEMAGEIARRQANQALEEEEVGAFTGRQAGQDSQAGRPVDESVHVGQVFTDS
jgi:hypothetical protein